MYTKERYLLSTIRHKERMNYIPKHIVVFMCLTFLWPYTGTIYISTSATWLN